MKAAPHYKLYVVAAITSLIAACFVLLIAVFHREENKRLAAESNALLESVTSLKEASLSNWFLDELNDVGLVIKSPGFVELISRYVEGKSKESTLVDAFNQIKSEHDFAELVFLNESGEYLTSTNPALTFNDSIDRNMLEMALKTDSGYVSDIYRSSIDHHLYVDFVSVIRNTYGKPLGGIIFKVHTESVIDKSLTDWEMASYRGEMSLIKQSSDKRWLYYQPRGLNSTSQSCWRPLPKRFGNNPLDRRHRLLRVVKLPHTPWYMMAELDNSKPKAEIGVAITHSIIMGAASVLILLAGLLYLSFYQEKKYTAKLRVKEKELEQINKQFQYSMDMLSEAVVLTDDQGLIQYMNLSAELFSGWKLEDLKGKPLDEQVPFLQEESGMPLLTIKNWFSGERAYNQNVAACLINKAGSRVPVICSLAPLKGGRPDSNGLIVILVRNNKKQTNPYEPLDTEEITN